MAEVTVTIDSSVVQRLTEPGGDVDKDMERRGRNVLNQAQLMSPVDTGRMRASGVLERADDGTPGAWDVTFPVDYALAVILGHQVVNQYGPTDRFVVGRPFLTDALQYAID